MAFTDWIRVEIPDSGIALATIRFECLNSSVNSAIAILKAFFLSVKMRKSLRESLIVNPI